MDKKEFLETLKTVLLKQKFTCKNRHFYFETEEVLITIGTQKSSFMDSYYINYGFNLKDGTPIEKLPKYNECNASGRFIINETDAIDYKAFEKQELEILLADFVEKNINPVINEGLSKYYEINPRALVVAGAKIRRYLNM